MVGKHLAEPPPRLERLWLACICGGMLVYFVQITILFPILPLYLSQHWDDAPIGFVVGALAAGLLCFRPAVGWLIDHWGRKQVLWLGLGLVLGILPLYVISPNPAWLMGVRVLHGISQAAFATASQTMLADLVPPHRRTALLGYLGMSNTIGFSLGPVLGAWIFATHGFRAVIGMQMALTVLGVLISLPLPWLRASGQTPRVAPSHFKQPKRSTDISLHPSSAPFPWQTVLSFPVRDATLVFFVGSFMHGGVVTFLPVFIPNSALFFSLNALIAIFVRFSLGRWGHRISKRWVVSLGIFCSGSAVIGMAVTQLGLGSLPTTYLILWSVLYGMGFGTLFPVLSAIVSLAAPVAVRGRVYSIFLAGFDGGMTLGGAGVQPLVMVMSLNSLFLMLGSLGVGMSAFAFRQFARPVAIAPSHPQP